jgi:hypothetical protein
MASIRAKPYTGAVTKQKRLNVLRPKDSKLGRATIMDRALAQRYGAPYVHLAAFAIDVDRVHRARPEAPELPDAWEVFLTEQRLKNFMNEAIKDPAAMLEEMCLAVMELPRNEELGALGGQLPFAIYVGVAHGHLPAVLGGCFQSWRRPPVDLIDELATLAKDEALLAKLANYCLDARIEPPLVEPVREALYALASSGQEDEVDE